MDVSASAKKLVHTQKDIISSVVSSVAYAIITPTNGIETEPAIKQAKHSIQYD